MRFRAQLPHALSVLILSSAVCGYSAAADPLRGVSEIVHTTTHKLFGQKPKHTKKDPCMEDLAKRLDWLEHHIETNGTIVPKHPDVWGEARLTKHRQEFEREFAKMLSKSEFTLSLQGSLRRSDQSFLGAALALDSAATAAEGASSSNVNRAQELLKAAQTQQIINRMPPQGVDLGKFLEGNARISIEPTIISDQMKRYFDHLNELRRINEGDDVSDSPGYGLHLVRIPISVFPGKATKQGYGAELTITAEPHLSQELLPMTFRNLVINDIASYAPLLWRVLEQYDKQAISNLEGNLGRIQKDNTEKTEYKEKLGEDAPQTQVRSEVEKTFRQIQISSAATTNTRAHRRPIPVSQLHDVFGGSVMGYLIVGAHKIQDPRLGHREYSDVQHYLVEELQAAYDFLSLPEALSLWEHCTPTLADAVRGRKRWLNAEPPNDEHKPPIRKLRWKFFKEITTKFNRSAYSVTASLAWMIIVESALLNQQLIDDIKHIKARHGISHEQIDHLRFFLPHPKPVDHNYLQFRPDYADIINNLETTKSNLSAASAVFLEYVRVRWPIIVFALDPVTQDQNIADVFSQRRELQLAAAVAVAQGNMSQSAAFQFARNLEADLETIALNRTHVGFSHGNDTFGWRFYPRFQTPPVKSTVAAFADNLIGFSNPGQELRTRKLEPGMRECVAIVLMPSFVPSVSFKTRANWFKLCNPRKKRLTMHDTMRLSRSIQAIRHDSYHVANCGLYRPGDVEHMMTAVQQLDRRLPVQKMMVQVPFENTLGGFEMFSAGVTDLAPELHGWYGAPGVKIAAKEDHACNSNGVSLTGANGEQCAGTCRATTLFLVGDGFSVHDTQVIAGGKCVPFTLLSRQVMRVSIPNDANVVTADDNRQHVDVHVATPYGVSSHLLIPTAKTVASSEIEELRKELTRSEFEFTEPDTLVITVEFNKKDWQVENPVLVKALEKKKFNLKFRGFTKSVHPQFKLPGAVRLGMLLRLKDGDAISSKLIKVPGLHRFQEGNVTLTGKAIFEEIEKELATPTDKLKPTDGEVIQLEAVFYLILVDDNALPFSVDNPIPIELHIREVKEVEVEVDEATQPQPLPAPEKDAENPSGKAKETILNYDSLPLLNRATFWHQSRNRKSTPGTASWLEVKRLPPVNANVVSSTASQIARRREANWSRRNLVRLSHQGTHEPRPALER